MNKRGITIFYTLMFGIIVIVLGLALAPVINSFADNAKADLFCYAPENMYTEAGCYGIEFIRILGTLGTIIIGVAIIAAKGAGLI